MVWFAAKNCREDVHVQTGCARQEGCHIFLVGHSFRISDSGNNQLVTTYSSVPRTSWGPSIIHSTAHPSQCPSFRKTSIMIPIIADSDDELLVSFNLHTSLQTFYYMKRREFSVKSSFLAGNGLGPKSGLCSTILTFCVQHTPVCVLWKKHSFMWSFITGTICRCVQSELSM